MLPWDMERLTREQAFEIYLEPQKDEHEPAGGNSLSHREQAFWSLQAAGDNWLTAERKYQEWERATGRRRNEPGRASSGGE